MDDAAAVQVFRAFGDENRLRILQLLQGGEMCACKLLEELVISQPTLSHHMAILCDAGIVVGRKDGKWTHYSLSASGCRQTLAMLAQYIRTEE